MSDLQQLVAACRDTPRDRTRVLALADMLDEVNSPVTARFIRTGGFLAVKLKGGYGGDGDGDGDGDGGCGYGGDGDGNGDGGCGGGDGDGCGGGDGYGCGDGDGCGGGDGGGCGGGDGGYGCGGGGNPILEALVMKDGLAIICTPGGYAPYVMIGWFRRVDFALVGQGVRVIRRFGRNGQLSVLAKTGPIRKGSKTELLDPSEEESVAISMCSRIIPCNPEAWAEECPKPEGWE